MLFCLTTSFSIRTALLKWNVEFRLYSGEAKANSIVSAAEPRFSVSLLNWFSLATTHFGESTQQAEKPFQSIDVGVVARLIRLIHLPVA